MNNEYKGEKKGNKEDKGIQGIQGVAGTDGDDAYVYIAYASDDTGTGFTTTFNSALDYIAIKTTTVAIPSPSASDFTGLWKNYKGIQGIQGIAGSDGEDGNGIVSIIKTETVGLVDTYTITFTDLTTFEYDVTNGKDGTGSGDMLASFMTQQVCHRRWLLVNCLIRCSSHR